MSHRNKPSEKREREEDQPLLFWFQVNQKENLICEEMSPCERSENEGNYMDYQFTFFWSFKLLQLQSLTMNIDLIVNSLLVHKESSYRNYISFMYYISKWIFKYSTYTDCIGLTQHIIILKKNITDILFLSKKFTQKNE